MFCLFVSSVNIIRHDLHHVNRMPKWIGYHKAIVVITGNAHCFKITYVIYIYIYIYIYILMIILIYDISIIDNNILTYII